MKKITFILLTFYLGLQFSLAQFEIVGSDEYGRIFDVTYDSGIENRLYAVTLGNHILVSNDNGINWDILYSHTDGNVEGLRFIPGENTLSFYNRFSLSGVAKLYILDLTTLTITKQFTLPYQNADEEWITQYDVWGNDTDIALIIQGFRIGFSNYAKVQYTADGGDSWDEVYYTVDNLNIFVNNVAISPDNPEKLFLVRGNGNTDIIGGLLISEDRGDTWVEKLPGIAFDPIAFKPNNPNEIWLGSSIGYGEQHAEGLYKSVDGGQSWEELPIEWTDYILDCITVIEINPENPDNIIVLEENEVAISEDGGETWVSHVYPDAYDNVFDYVYGLKASYNPFNENEIYVSANYFPLFSTDKGENFTKLNTPFFVSTGNLNLYSQDEEEHIYYGVQFGYVHKNLNTEEENEYEIMPLNYFSNSPGTTVYSDKNIAGRVYSFTGGFMGSNLKASNDHGENTVQLFSLFANQFDAVASDPNDPEIIWASFSNFGEEPQLYKIDFNDIDNITQTSVTLPVQDIIYEIYFPSNNSDNLIIAVGARIYQTNDDGISWELTSNGLEELSVSFDAIIKLTQNPLNLQQLTIATTRGIYTSTDTGFNWTKIYDSLVHNVQHSTATDGDIVAAVHTSSVSDLKFLYSKDGGENWNEILQDEFFYTSTNSTLNSTAVKFFEESAEVYIGANDLGLVKYTINLEDLSTGDIEVLNGDVIVYPNPANDIVNIAGKENVVSVEIYDMTGRRLIVDHKNKIEVSTLNSGIYMLKITTADGKTVSRKLIKK